MASLQIVTCYVAIIEALAPNHAGYSLQAMWQAAALHQTSMILSGSAGKGAPVV